MCPTCVDNLRTAIDFRETCIRTELQLAGGDSIPIQTDDEELVVEPNPKSENYNKDDFVSIFPADGENGQTTVVESLSHARTNQIVQGLHPAAADPNSIALGAQIYEDLLNEYKGNDKTVRPKTRKITVIRGKEKRPKRLRSSEPKPKREKRTKEEKNRIRREQIRALPLNHVCDQCGASFRVRCNLTIHMLRHTQTKNYKCPECPKQFYDAYMRNIHIRVRHRGELPFICNYCPKAYGSSNTRYLHEKYVKI